MRPVILKSALPWKQNSEHIGRVKSNERTFADSYHIQQTYFCTPTSCMIYVTNMNTINRVRHFELARAKRRLTGTDDFQASTFVSDTRTSTKSTRLWMGNILLLKTGEIRFIPLQVDFILILDFGLFVCINYTKCLHQMLCIIWNFLKISNVYHSIPLSRIRSKMSPAAYKMLLECTVINF